MACEWNCRYPTRKKPRPKIFAGAKGRIDSLVEIFKHIKDDVRLYIHPAFYDHAVSLGLPLHVTLYKQVEEIINSQYEFIKSKIIELDIEDENVKTNFIIKYLGKLYVDLDKTRNKLKRENERRKTT
jgi:hypothetical protein